VSRTAPHAVFAEVPTEAFAHARALSRKAGIDAASVETQLAAARQEIADAARDLAVAIGRLLGEAPSGRERRRERRRRRNGRVEEVHE
jgi:hypothetical protein